MFMRLSKKEENLKKKKTFLQISEVIPHSFTVEWRIFTLFAIIEKFKELKHCYFQINHINLDFIYQKYITCTSSYILMGIAAHYKYYFVVCQRSIKHNDRFNYLIMIWRIFSIKKFLEYSRRKISLNFEKLFCFYVSFQINDRVN